MWWAGFTAPGKCCRTSTANGAGEQDADFYEGKLAAAEYFLNWELPLVSRDIEVLSSREATCNNVKASYF